MEMKTTSFERFDREVLDGILEDVLPYSEMSFNEKYFLNGIVRFLKPRKILEVGVSSGGGTAIMLNAIHDRKEARLISVDYMEQAYKYPNRKSGFIIEEKFPEFMGSWSIYRGGDVSAFIEKIGADIDLAVIDTMHLHPWETLNFLCILPFLSKSAWVVLHDIAMHYSDRRSLACKYLFDLVVSERKETPPPDSVPLFANIGAFQVEENTHKYVENLFGGLSLPWACEIKGEDLESVSRILSSYYPEELCDVFKKSIAFQDKMRKNITLYSYLKEFMMIFTPKIFKTFQSLKRKFKLRG